MIEWEKIHDKLYWLNPRYHSGIPYANAGSVYQNETGTWTVLYNQDRVASFDTLEEAQSHLIKLIKHN